MIVLFAFLRPCFAEEGQNARFLLFDTHNHILPYVGQGAVDFDNGAMAALRAMDEYGIKKVILMPHPFTSGQSDSYTYGPLKKIAEQYPDRFLFMGGGGTLNIMLHDAAKGGGASPEQKQKFEETAEKIIADGAVGFGEMVIEHFSMQPNHPYESVAADHPLLLLLSDIAARHDVPIEIHIEAVPVEIDRPGHIPSTNNPQRIAANIDQFEHLLTHNRSAIVIWSHAGWDNTGHRTPELMGRLLKAHPNLFMNIKIRKNQGDAMNHPLKPGGINPAWLSMLNEFPDRFMIGTDQFYQPMAAKEKRRLELEGSKRFMMSLPEGLARKIGYENAARLFKINL
jgi:predicted TIM-barrel fold metal-dependent hydrolase